LLCMCLLCLVLPLQSICETLQWHKEDYEFDESTVLKRSRRDLAGTLCTPSAGLETTLNGSVSSHVFENDPNQSISLSWLGDKGVILALTTQSATLSPSKLYRSIDRGSTFEDVTEKQLGISPHIRKSNGIITCPLDTTKVILISQDSPFLQTLSIFVSEDSASSFEKVQISFKVDPSTLIFSKQNCSRILAKDVQLTLHQSHDFGRSWMQVNEWVPSAQWDPLDSDTFYYTLDKTKTSYEISMENELYRVSAVTGESTLIARDAHSFIVQDHFIFLSVQFCGKNGSRVLYTSKNQGHAWNAAQVPMIAKDEFYSLLDMSEEMVFLHVDKKGDTGHGDIYTSDERGIVYSLSLTRHLYPNDKGVNDFYRVKSMPGTYITSMLKLDNTVQSLITHDKGGVWKNIKAPEGSKCPTDRTCDLHIHNSFSASKDVKLPSLPLSSENTVGLILVHGNLGDSLSIKNPDVYVSGDGGLSWSQPATLKGPHHFGIGDSGGLLYAVPALITDVNYILFSFDEGKCWFSHNFTDVGIIVTGLLAEPGEKSADVTVWGFDSHKTNKPWVSFNINFKTVMGKACTTNQYERWGAHDQKCVLGSQLEFMRRKPDTFCVNNERLDVRPSHKPCSCGLSDFICDFGYMRQANEECVKETGLLRRDICIDGVDEIIITQGYRKIPGDKCTGKTYSREPEILHKNCEVYNYTQIGNPKQFPSCSATITPNGAAAEGKSTSNSSGSSGLITFLVLLVFVLVGALGVVVYYKRHSLLRVQYRTFDNNLLVSENDMLGNDVADDDEANILFNERDSGNFTTLQSPGNLPTTYDLGQPMPYHDDSDEDLLT